MAKKKPVVRSSPALAKAIDEEKQSTHSSKIKHFFSGKAGVEKYIIVAVWMIAIAFILYMVFASINVPTSYTLKADSPSIFDNTSELYIDNAKALGPVQVMNGVAVRPMTPRSFNIVFNPKNKDAWKDKNLMLELELMGSGSELYINDQLVLPNFEDYDLVKDFSDSQVWVSKELRAFYNKNTLADKATPEEYVVANFEGASVYSMKDLNYTLLQPVVTDYKKEWTDINATFRDNLKLAVYVEDSLDLNFIKQDLQMYLGPDEYTLEISSLDGNVLFSTILPDDGEAKATKTLGKEQPFEFKLDDKNGITKGVYYIAFTKDEYNQAADSSLKDISINTNKVMIVGNFLPITPITFYAKVNLPKQIGFYYWWVEKDQNIVYSNESIDGNKVIVLDSNWAGKDYFEALNKEGAYKFFVTKGYLWVKNDLTYFKENGLFNLSNTINMNLKQIIVIDKQKLTQNKDSASLVVLTPNKVKILSLLDNKLFIKSATMSKK